jgi:hypothetical protein
MAIDPTHFEHCLVHEGYWCTCGTWAKYLTTDDEAREPADTEVSVDHRPTT